MTWCSRASTIFAGAAFQACCRSRRRNATPGISANPVPALLQPGHRFRLGFENHNSRERPIMSPAEARLKQVPSDMTEAEWNQRVNLAACYRLVAFYGWDDLVDTHISARVPGPDHHFLINPYGLMFDEITASSLVKVDLHGNQLTKSDYSINPAGFTIHSAIHEA